MSGEMSEWFKEAVLKTVGLIAPGVRIPHHPINWRDAREAEGDSLLNCCIVSVPRVRIPLSPMASV